MKRLFIIATLMCILIVTEGCGKLFGGLRTDLDDGYRNQATTGGVWPERQMLDQSDLEAPSVYADPGSIAHSERRPGSGMNGAPRSWGNEEIPQGAERIRQPEETMQQESRIAQASGRKIKNGGRATRADFIDDSQSEGSLWASGGQTNYFFTKNSVKSPGDIITVKTEDGFIRDVAAEVKRNLTEEEMDEELASTKKKKGRSLASSDPAQASPGGATPASTDQAKSSAASAKGESTSDPFGGTSSGEDVKVTPADVDLSQSIGLKTGETIMAEIVERYPSGNYKIRGTKRLNFHGSVRLMTFVAIARANDIAEGDVIDSGKLYEYKLNVQR